MKNKVFLTVTTLALTGALAIGAHDNAFAKAKLNSISEASVTTQINGIQLDGDVVTFTIIEGARKFDKSASGKVSAMYDASKAKPSECPRAKSNAVSKEVKDYNMMSGKARIQAKFDDKAVAKSAFNSGCIIIDDT